MTNIESSSLGHSRNFIILNQFIWLMLGAYLIVDSLTGFVRFNTGLDLKISLLFKLPLLGFILVSTFLLERTKLLFLLSLICLILFGPIRHIMLNANAEHIISELSYTVKMLTPIIVFTYLRLTYKPLYFMHNIFMHKAMWTIAIVVIVNLGLGLMGFGFTTYYTGGEGVGTTGFFYGANEVGALLVVVMCFVLQQCWIKSKLFYVVASIVFLLLGISIATKVAALSAMLVVLLLPLVNERHKIFYLTRLKIVIFFVVAIVALISSLYLFDFFLNLTVVSRLKWILAQHGIIGLILSGREVFVDSLLSLYLADDNIYSYIFGIGISGVMEVTDKFSSEVDPVDTLVWFGLMGLSVMLTLSGYFIYNSFKFMSNSNSPYAPAVFLCNVILVSVSCTAGHIWISGMLGIAWAMFNFMVFEPSQNIKK